MFGKNKNKGSVLAVKRMIFEQIADDDERAAELVEELRVGNPLCLNFESLEAMAKNKLLAFFSGACYALEGEVVLIRDNVYMFALKVDFIDGSLKEFIEKKKQN